MPYLFYTGYFYTGILNTGDFTLLADLTSKGALKWIL